MSMLVAILLPLFVSQADQVITRNESYLNRIKTMSVRIEVKCSKMPGVGRGKLLAKRPGQVYFDMVWSNEHYTVCANPPKAIELDHLLGLYADLKPTGTITPPDSEISSIPAYGIPVMILGTGLKSMLPRGVKINYVGKDRRIGVLADHLDAKLKREGGELAVDMWFDEKGALREYRIDINEPRGRVISTMKLSDYVVNKPLPESSFPVEPPLGFSPSRFNDSDNMIQKGETLKLDDYVDPVTGKSFSLKSSLNGHCGLVAILGDPEPASANLCKWLASGAVKASIFIFGPSRPSLPADHPSVQFLLDPQGKALAAARAPGTPLWAVVDGNGVVIQAWYGFDPVRASEYAEEVNATITALKAND
jgi:outer membrane lipoprotein-sorting protein